MRMQVISWHTCDHTINGYHWVRVACHLRLSWTLKNLVLFKIDTTFSNLISDVWLIFTCAAQNSGKCKFLLQRCNKGFTLISFH